jgi:uncharacterized protein
MSTAAIQAYLYGYLHKEARARKLTALAGNGYKVAGVVRGALTGDTKRFSLENVEELPGDPWIAVSRSRKALSAAELRAFHKAYNADPDGKGVPYYYMVETPDGEELVAFQGDDRLYTTGEATKVGAALGIPKEQLDFKGSDKEPLSRYTDDKGTGAYEAAMAQAPDEGRLLETLRAAWNLPNPGNLKKHPQARSYFTEAGDAEFDKHHRHILETALAKALKKQQIGSGELNAVYRDKYQVIGESIPKEASTLFHGSSNKLTELLPRDLHGDPGVGEAVFATPKRSFALAYTGRPWSDRDIVQGGMGQDDEFLAEVRPGAFKDIFEGATGYLHHLPAKPFKPRATLGSDWEQVSTKPVKPTRVEEVKNILEQLQGSGVRLVKYDPKSKELQANLDWSRKRLKLMSPEDRIGYLKWRLQGMQDGGAAEFEQVLRDSLRQDQELAHLADIETAEPIPKEALDLSKYDQMYHTFDSGHGPGHQQKTMAAARALAEAHAPNKLHLAELAARLHDVGLSVNREAHESEGARIVAEDEQFLKELTPRERAILINAIRQHRASTGKPRSIVGKIVSDADRVSSASTDGALARAIGFGKANHPELTKEENERRAYLYLASKYKPGGTGWRFYFPETGEKLNEIYAPIVQRAAELQRDVQ